METKNLTDLADRFAAHRGWKLSTVSTYAAGDGKFFDRLKNGAGCTLKTAARLYQWFSERWPTDLEWPRDIPRPSASKPAKGRAA
jgi:hypothetical protein